MADSGLQPYKDGYYLWKYVPSLPAAIVFAILFCGITTLHLVRLWKSRLWFCTWFVLGGLSTSLPKVPADLCSDPFLTDTSVV